MRPLIQARSSRIGGVNLRHLIIYLALCVVLLLSSCTRSPAETREAISSITSAPSTGTSPPTVVPSQTPYPTPTFPPWPTPDGKQDVLPAPLYFVSGYETDYGTYFNQIVRLETDGRTRTAITPPITKRIKGFDISPVDGSIVLAAQGSLWLVVDPTSGNIERLITGLPNPEGTNSLFEIVHPAWSPNGDQIAYADGGIRILDMASGTRIDVVENSSSEDVAFGSSPYQSAVVFHSPVWSPDGEALLFHKQTPTAPTRMLFIPKENKLNDIPGSLATEVVWSRDGKTLLLDYWWVANVAYIPGIEPAFLQIARNDFEVQVLQSHNGQENGVYFHPFESSDNRILFFQLEFCIPSPCHSYALAEGISTQDGFEMKVLRKNALPTGVQEVVWYDTGQVAALLINHWSDWFIAIMNIDTGEILLLAQEDERPWPIVWDKP